MMERTKQPVSQVASFKDALLALTIILIGWALCIVNVNVGSSSIFQFAIGLNLDFVSKVLGYGLIVFGISKLLKFHVSENYQLLMRVAMVVGACNGAIVVFERFTPVWFWLRLPGLMLTIVSVAGMCAFVSAMIEFARHYNLVNAHRVWKKSLVVAAWWGAFLVAKTGFELIELTNWTALAFNTKQFIKWTFGFYGPISGTAAILGIVTFVFATVSIFKMHKEIEALIQSEPVAHGKIQPEVKSG